MKVLKPRILMLFLVLLMGMVFVGCSSDSEEASNNQSNGTNEESNNDGESNASGDEVVELTFAWWGSQTRHDRTQEVIDLFESQNPNIKINAEFSGWEGYWEKLATRAAGQSLPDLFQMSYAYLAEYESRDLLADLNPYVESGVLNFDNVDSLYLDTGVLNDGLYAVNLGANSFTIVYDPALFEEAGIPEPEPGYTYEDLANMARDLQSNLDGVDYGIKTFDHIDAWKHYLRQNDIWLFNDENNALGYEDDQLMVDFYQYWVDLIEEGVATPPDLDSSVQGTEDELIVHGTVPMMATNSNSLVALQQAADRPLKATIYPTLPGGVEGHFIAPSQYVSMAATTDHPEEAAKFIDFMTNDLEANEILMAERGVPISSEVREHLSPMLDDATQKTFDYLELAQEHSREVNIISPPGEGEIRTLMEQISEAVNYGELTPEDAAEKFRNDASAILERANAAE